MMMFKQPIAIKRQQIQEHSSKKESSIKPNTPLKGIWPAIKHFLLGRCFLFPKEKDNRVEWKKEEGFEIKKPVLRYTKRKSLGRKGLQRKPESAKSGTEEDVEAYMKERVDEPSSEEFTMSSIPQGPAPARIVKWQIIKTEREGLINHLGK
ncbi:hypothetical protein Tco_0128419 [Tanacetum coccineum]